MNLLIDTIKGDNKLPQLDEIQYWAQDGIEQSATHFVVVYDTYSDDYYPKYFYSESSFMNAMKTPNNNAGQLIKDSYDLSKDIETQYKVDIKELHKTKQNNKDSQSAMKKRRKFFDDEFQY